jgi:hypothetical protein
MVSTHIVTRSNLMKDYEAMTNDERDDAIEELRERHDNILGSEPAQIIALALACIIGDMIPRCGNPEKAFYQVMTEIEHRMEEEGFKLPDIKEPETVRP